MSEDFALVGGAGEDGNGGASPAGSASHPAPAPGAITSRQWCHTSTPHKFRIHWEEAFFNRDRMAWDSRRFIFFFEAMLLDQGRPVLWRGVDKDSSKVLWTSSRASPATGRK